MIERRKLKRRHLIYYLRVYNSKTGSFLGHLVDITADGLMLLADHRVRLGRTIPMRMRLPGERRGGRQLELEATSLWCSRDVNADFWDVGFRIVDLNRRQMSTIDTLIEDYGFKD